MAKRKAKRKKNPAGVRIVHNKLLGGWYVVRGPHQTPLNGRFASKLEAEAYLRRKNPRRKNPNSKPYTLRFIYKLHGRKWTRHSERMIDPSKYAAGAADMMKDDFVQMARDWAKRNPGYFVKVTKTGVKE